MNTAFAETKVCKRERFGASSFFAVCRSEWDAKHPSYRQDWCGCVYSRRERERQKRAREEA